MKNLQKSLAVVFFVVVAACSGPAEESEEPADVGADVSLPDADTEDTSALDVDVESEPDAAAPSPECIDPIDYYNNVSFPDSVPVGYVQCSNLAINLTIAKEECQYPLRPPCTTAADCAPGEICLCGGDVNPEETRYKTRYVPRACVRPECESDADCAGFPCGISLDECSHTAGVFCRTAADECYGDLDCPSTVGREMDGHCFYEPAESRWKCDKYYDCE